MGVLKRRIGPILTLGQPHKVRGTTRGLQRKHSLQQESAKLRGPRLQIRCAQSEVMKVPPFLLLTELRLQACQNLSTCLGQPKVLAWAQMVLPIRSSLEFC